MDRKEIQEAHEKYYPEYDAMFKDMMILNVITKNYTLCYSILDFRHRVT